MKTRAEFAALTVEEQIEYCLRRASDFKRLARQLQAKQNIRTAAEIDTEISSRQDAVFGTGR